MGNPLGSMFSVYLQMAAYKDFSGVNGLAGWRWPFIIDGVITLPIVNVALFPALSISIERWFLSEAEFELATSRRW